MLLASTRSTLQLFPQLRNRSPHQCHPAAPTPKDATGQQLWGRGCHPKSTARTQDTQQKAQGSLRAPQQVLRVATRQPTRSTTSGERWDRARRAPSGACSRKRAGDLCKSNHRASARFLWGHPALLPAEISMDAGVPACGTLFFFIFCLSLQEKPRVLPNRGCTREGALLASLTHWQSSHEALRAPRGGSATWGNPHRGLHLCLQVSIPLPGIYGAQQRGPSACTPLPGAASGHAAAPDSVRGTLLLGALRQHGGPKHPLRGLPASCFGASRQPGGCWHSKPAAHPTSRAAGAHSTP